jgi:hypothetical protein
MTEEQLMPDGEKAAIRRQAGEVGSSCPSLISLLRFFSSMELHGPIATLPRFYLLAFRN